MWDMLAIRSVDDAAEVLASLEARVWECPTEVCLVHEHRCRREISNERA